MLNVRKEDFSHMSTVIWSYKNVLNFILLLKIIDWIYPDLWQETKRAEAEEQRIVEEAKKVAELREELDAHAEIDLAKVK